MNRSNPCGSGIGKTVSLARRQAIADGMTRQLRDLHGLSRGERAFRFRVLRSGWGRLRWRGASARGWSGCVGRTPLCLLHLPPQGGEKRSEGEGGHPPLPSASPPQGGERGSTGGCGLDLGVILLWVGELVEVFEDFSVGPAFEVGEDGQDLLDDGVLIGSDWAVWVGGGGNFFFGGRIFDDLQSWTGDRRIRVEGCGRFWGSCFCRVLRLFVVRLVELGLVGALLGALLDGGGGAPGLLGRGG